MSELRGHSKRLYRSLDELSTNKNSLKFDPEAVFNA